MLLTAIVLSQPHQQQTTIATLTPVPRAVETAASTQQPPLELGTPERFPRAVATLTWREQAELDGRRITAAKTVRRCARYLPLVERWAPDFPELEPALVLAVAAKESACIETMDDGVSVGLMAVTPRSWLFADDDLRKPAVNIYAGMFILNAALHSDENESGTMREALAAYNCGWVSLKRGVCISVGGWAYADSVLSEWLPLMRAQLEGLP